MEELERLELGLVLQKLADQHGWHRAQWLVAIETLWKEVVGESIFQHTAILTLTTDGVLLVAVPSSVWSQELLYYKPAILSGLHSRLPTVSIHDLRTRVRAQWKQGAALDKDPVYSPYFPTNPALHSSPNLAELLIRVQESYETAAQIWLTQGFHPCQHCHAPTLKAYALCMVCDLSSR